MNSEIKIAEKDENTSWEDITKLLNESYAEWVEKDLVYSAAVQDAATTEKRVGDGVCLLAFKNDTLVGTISYRIYQGKQWYEGEKTLIFFQLAVDNKFKSLGIARILMDHVEKIAQFEKKVDCIVADTALKATRLLNWYHRRGYKSVSLVSWLNTNYYSVVFLVDFKNKYNKIYLKIRYLFSYLWCKFNFDNNGKRRILAKCIFKIYRIIRK